MFASFGASLDDRLAALGLPAGARQQLEEEKTRLGSAKAPQGVDATTEAKVERAVEGAFVSGYRVVMLVAAGAALASSISAALFVRGKNPSGDAAKANAEDGTLPRSLNA
jgi:hypothetical protein